MTFGITSRRIRWKSPQSSHKKGRLKAGRLRMGLNFTCQGTRQLAQKVLLVRSLQRRILVIHRRNPIFYSQRKRLRLGGIYIQASAGPILWYWEAVLNHLSCPRCNALMRWEKIISDGEFCTSWVCTRCGEVVDKVIIENRALEIKENKGNRFNGKIGT